MGPNTSTFGDRRKFLTYLNHEIQTVYCLFAALVGLLSVARGKTHHYTIFNKVVDYFYFVCLIFASMVGILFWSIFFYDRSKILPKEYEAFYPMTINLFQHGFVAVNMWMELILIRHRVSKSYKLDLIIISVIAVMYTIWLFVIKKNLGTFPYPFLNDFTAPQLALFILCSVGLSWIVSFNRSLFTFQIPPKGFTLFFVFIDL